MRRISTLAIIALSHQSVTGRRDCGDPPARDNGQWHCDDTTCSLKCGEDFGLVSPGTGPGGRKIKCRGGQWVPAGDAQVMASCTNVCPHPESHMIDRSEPNCRNFIGGGSCTPGVDCVNGDYCAVDCIEGFELTPAPEKDNVLNCYCNTVRCKWQGQGKKLTDQGVICSPKKQNRIINGTDAIRGEDGYAISLGYFSKGKGGRKEWTHFCGGVLINPKWGVTAAHCQQRGLRGIVGEYEINKRDGGEVQCRIRQQIRHPEYDYRTENDIMMVQLQCRRLRVGRYIFPAVLPEAGEDPAPGVDCRICGWGNTDYPVYVPAKKLQCVTLPVIESEICNGPDHYIGSIHDRIMCIGNLLEGGKDSCQGDSGGPANCGGKIHGIVMGGLYCAKPNYPGVYTRTSRYVDWITNTAKSSGRRRRRTKTKGKK